VPGFVKDWGDLYYYVSLTVNVTISTTSATAATHHSATAAAAAAMIDLLDSLLVLFIIYYYYYYYYTLPKQNITRAHACGVSTPEPPPFSYTRAHQHPLLNNNSMQYRGHCYWRLSYQTAAARSPPHIFRGFSRHPICR
jgi:hypothetical protein